MQLTGNQFSDNTALFGNDLTTLPDFPAEIRAPAGSLAGVSSFQLQFSSKDIHTPGDSLDVLVAMNPAALKAHLCDLKDNGMLIVNLGGLPIGKIDGFAIFTLWDVGSGGPFGKVWEDQKEAFVGSAVAIWNLQCSRA